MKRCASTRAVWLASTMKLLQTVHCTHDSHWYLDTLQWLVFPQIDAQASISIVKFLVVPLNGTGLYWMQWCMWFFQHCLLCLCRLDKRRGSLASHFHVDSRDGLVRGKVANSMLALWQYVWYRQFLSLSLHTSLLFLSSSLPPLFPSHS